MHKHVLFSLPGGSAASFVDSISSMLKTDGAARTTRGADGRFLPAWNEAPYVPIREWRRLFESLHTAGQAFGDGVFGVSNAGERLLVVCTYDCCRSVFLGYEVRLVYSYCEVVVRQVSFVDGL